MPQRSQTTFLVSEERPDGYRLEDLLREIRNDILVRCTHAMNDERPETNLVMANNVQILAKMSEIIALAENSTEVLSRVFGAEQGAMHEPPTT